MRLTPRRDVPLLELPVDVPVEELLRRYDPGLRRRRGRFVLSGDVVVTRRRGALTVAGSDRVARGIGRHLGGRWRQPPAGPGERDEPIEDMLRVYVPRKLVPADLAALLQPVLPGVAIREDPKLGLFWFDDEDSELTVSAWAVQAGTAVPPVVGGPHEALYECGVDDVHGPTEESARQAWQIGEALREGVGGIPVDRYGFLVGESGDLFR